MQLLFKLYCLSSFQSRRGQYRLPGRQDRNAVNGQRGGNPCGPGVCEGGPVDGGGVPGGCT